MEMRSYSPWYLKYFDSETVEVFELNDQVIGTRPAQVMPGLGGPQFLGFVYISTQTGEVVGRRYIKNLKEIQICWRAREWDYKNVWNEVGRASFFDFSEWSIGGHTPIPGSHDWRVWKDVPANVMAYEILNLLECHHGDPESFLTAVEAAFTHSRSESSPSGGYRGGEDAQHQNADSSRA